MPSAEEGTGGVDALLTGSDADNAGEVNQLPCIEDAPSVNQREREAAAAAAVMNAARRMAERRT